MVEIADICTYKVRKLYIKQSRIQEGSDQMAKLKASPKLELIAHMPLFKNIDSEKKRKSTKERKIKRNLTDRESQTEKDKERLRNTEKDR